MIPSAQKQTPISLEKARSFKERLLWENLGNTLIHHAITFWLNTLSSKATLASYQSSLNSLIEKNFLRAEMTLQEFSILNLDAIVDKIKLVPGWSENTKQARAAAFISFTRFLSRRTEGFIKKAQASTEGASKTFFRVYDKVSSNSMTRAEWTEFLNELEIINKRDCLIAKLLLQGGKRANEVLKLQIEQINQMRNQITFHQSKSKGLIKETIITYPPSVMRQIEEYVCGRERGFVFITRNGRRVCITQIAQTFAKAGFKAKIPFKVTPQTLRATAVTYLKQQGFHDIDIMKVTGHCSSEMVYAYDKSDRANNPSRKISLVG